jgi:N-methylhydantoinase B
MTHSTHIDQEGIHIEPSLIRRGDEWNRDVLDRLLSAVRTPDERLGDLEAQLAANHVGAVALRRMITRHGLAAVQHYGRALLDYSQAFMARALASIPRGEYRFEDAMDDDGAGGAPIPIRVTLRADTRRVQVDLRDCPDQVPGCINCPEAVTRSAVYYCFACLMDPGVPLNGGAFRDIEVLTRPGSLLHARYPAAVVAGNTETSQRVVDTVLGALAQALPDRIPAASCGTMSSVAIGNSQSASGNPWSYYETIGGGTGAGPTFDGASAIQCHMTNTLNTPAEALEMQYPLRVHAFHVHPNGGAGRHRGGHGIRRVIEALEHCEGTILSDRRSTRPYGLQGGHHGDHGANTLHAPEPRPLPGKCHVRLAPGDRLEILTPGGGGWGG